MLELLEQSLACYNPFVPFVAITKSFFEDIWGSSLTRDNMKQASETNAKNMLVMMW